MGTVTMTLEEYNALRAMAGFGAVAGDPSQRIPGSLEINAPIVSLPRRKVSAYNRKYKAAFKKVSGRFKLKSGKWKKNGFRLAVKAAHKMAGGKK